MAIVCAQSLSHVRLFVTPWTVACQGSSAHGTLQARTLEWLAISSSRGSSWPREGIHIYVSCIGRWILYHCTIWEAPLWSLQCSIRKKYKAHNIVPFFKKKLYLFIWLKQVLVAAHRILSCSLWDLVPWPGTELGFLLWELRVLATGPSGKSP